MLSETEYARTIESRSRMISFRVTEEEFDRFRRLCAMKGVRNVSEAIRIAVNHLLAEGDHLLEPQAEQTLQDRFDQLESRLSHLESQITPPLHARSAANHQ